MAKLPTLRSLKIRQYDLYPGIDNSSELSIDFDSGLTLILGTNGLGKTTLITLIYRMLTGPYDIPGFESNEELGNLDLTTNLISKEQRRIFANRAFDFATNATAELEFSLGHTIFNVRRKLADLSLSDFSLNGHPLPVPPDAKDEPEYYQSYITHAAEIWAFSEWILILKNLIFFFEDRRALVWDPAAQRQILRFLCLSPDKAKDLYISHRQILQADSSYRNQRYVLNKLEKRILKDLAKHSDKDGIATQIAAVDESLNQLSDKLHSYRKKLIETDKTRKELRIQLLRDEQALDTKIREAQRAKFASIRSAFPTLNETTSYILTTLAIDGKCLVCDSETRSTQDQMMEAVENNICPICRSPHIDYNTPLFQRIPFEQIKEVEAQITELQHRISILKSELQKYLVEFEDINRSIEDIQSEISSRQTEKAVLSGKLPAKEGDSAKLRLQLGAIREQLKELTDELEKRTDEFPGKLKELREEVLNNAESIKTNFNRYAHDFMLEICTLTWDETHWPLGQTGHKVAFPTFYLNISSVDGTTQSRRDGPTSVSESQREFIELAFRMALMKVFCGDFPASLVIDTPESSLDAVFVKRAADVLSMFARENDNRLLIASNLIDGELIPTLLQKAQGEHDPAIVNLMDIARPTAAVRLLKNEYISKFKSLTNAKEAR